MLSRPIILIKSTKAKPYRGDDGLGGVLWTTHVVLAQIEVIVADLVQ